MTLPDKIQKLESQLAESTTKISELEASNAALLERATKAEAEAASAKQSLTTETAKVTTLTSQLEAANKSVETLTAENKALKESSQSAGQKAVQIMASVGQPDPVNADTKTSASNSSEKGLTGLARTEAYFRSRNKNQ